MRAAVRDASAAAVRVAGELGEAPPEAPEVPPLGWILLDVAEERFHAVASRHREMRPGWERRCVFEAYGRAVLARNARDPAGMRRPAVRALAELNLYRMALGFTPLAHEARLVKMAADHSREMSRLGYFDHESPVPENRMPRHRAQNAGYHAAVSECISARGDPKTAVDTWKWDGGHHRTMVDPNYAEVGLAYPGPTVLDAGMGDEKAIPVLRERD
jgi:hypothetical protein